MPEWLMQLLVAGGGLGLLATGFGSWLKDRREDRRAALQREIDEKKALKEHGEKLQEKVESLLHDAVAQAKELNAQMVERIKMDDQQNTVLTAATDALKENAKLLARLEPLLAKLLELKP